MSLKQPKSGTMVVSSICNHLLGVIIFSVALLKSFPLFGIVLLLGEDTYTPNTSQSKNFYSPSAHNTDHPGFRPQHRPAKPSKRHVLPSCEVLQASTHRSSNDTNRISSPVHSPFQASKRPKGGQNDPRMHKKATKAGLKHTRFPVLVGITPGLYPYAK